MLYLSTGEFLKRRMPFITAQVFLLHHVAPRKRKGQNTFLSFRRAFGSEKHDCFLLRHQKRRKYLVQNIIILHKQRVLALFWNKNTKQC